MTDSYVTVAGNLTADPSVGATRTGDPFTNFRVAVNHGYFDRERNVWLDTGASFYQVTAFRALAVNVVDSLRKGMPVVVHGKLRIKQWENGDKHGTEAQITAVSVGPNLNYGQADFTAVRRPHFSGTDPADDENVQADLAGAAPPADVNGEEQMADGYDDAPPVEEFGDAQPTEDLAETA